MLAGTWPKDDPINESQHVIGLLRHWTRSRTMAFPSNISGPEAKLLKGLLEPYLWERMTLVEVLEHPWLSTASQ